MFILDGHEQRPFALLWTSLGLFQDLVVGDG